MSLLIEKPLEIYLQQEQFNALEKLSQKQGKSVTDLVIESIEQLLIDTPIEEDPLWDIIGIGSSGVGDMASEHDKYLYEIESNEES